MSSLREEFYQFIETLPTRVGETPKEVVFDWFVTTLKERIEKELRPCINYCKVVNGRSDCKNCGLDEDTITRLLE